MSTETKDKELVAIESMLNTTELAVEQHLLSAAEAQSLQIQLQGLLLLRRIADAMDGITDELKQLRGRLP